MQTLAARLEDLINVGWSVPNEKDYSSWENRVSAFLASAIDAASAAQFKELGELDLFDDWHSRRDRQLGHLEGLSVRIVNSGTKKDTFEAFSEISPLPAHITKKVFVVHGHDNETKESVARFIERLRLLPIILHEQPNAGRTVIEKFEVFSDVGFAVVLLTPDDIGASSMEPANLYPRARQNVILELGYFMGKLSRFRVCALYKSGVEIPSDYRGVLYIELDPAGAWKQKLAQELVEANFSIDLDGLLHG